MTDQSPILLKPLSIPFSLEGRSPPKPTNIAMRMPRPQGHVSRLLRPEARVVLTLPPSYVFCLTNATAAKITKRQQTTCDAGARIGGSGTALSTGSHRRFGTSKTSPSSKGLTLVPLPFRRFGPFSTLTPFPGHDTFFGLVSLPSNVPRTHDKRERTKKKNDGRRLKRRRPFSSKFLAQNFWRAWQDSID